MITNFKNTLVAYVKKHKKIIIASFAIVVIVSAFEISHLYFSNKEETSIPEDYFNFSYKSLSISIPKNLNFAGEKVPINEQSIRIAFAKEVEKNLYSTTHTTQIHKRCNYYFPIIEPILEKYKIPNDFKYIAIVESQLTNVVSPKGASGIWQIVEPTALHYGLTVNEEIDERFNITKSTEAACKYFNEAYKIFHNWTLVAASYNRGMGGIQVQLDKQNKENFYELLLTKETAKYIYKILATKEIISRPKVYGYDVNSKIGYFNTKKISIDTSISNLEQFAHKIGVDYTTLIEYNPWIRSNKLTNIDHKKIILEIPFKKTSFIKENKEIAPITSPDSSSVTLKSDSLTNN
ncbi:MAG: lytic transglycosylase domain-containing protein [Bacteroidia bacterium]|nr:lytic transglycosylase domain-containing protein [Bacteroidia bacterium]